MQKAAPILFCHWQFLHYGEAMRRGLSPERLAIATRLNKELGLRLVFTCSVRQNPLAEIRAKLRFAKGMPDAHYILMGYTPVLSGPHPGGHPGNRGAEIDQWLTRQHRRDYLVVEVVEPNVPAWPLDPIPEERILRTARPHLDEMLALEIIERLA